MDQCNEVNCMRKGSEEQASRTNLRISVQERRGGAVGVGERGVAKGGIIFVDWTLCAWKRSASAQKLNNRGGKKSYPFATVPEDLVNVS